MTGDSGGGPDPVAGGLQGPGVIDIDLGAIEANFRHLGRLCGGRHTVIPVLKADAYGLGAAKVAHQLERAGARLMAVGSLGDAAAIRRAGVGVALQLLSGLRPEDVAHLRRLDLIPSIGDEETLALVAASAGSGPMAVCVKVDCGFGRFGVPLSRAAALIRCVGQEPRVRLHGIFTHIPFGEARGACWAADRLQDFRLLVAQLAAEGIRPPLVQALASPGVLAGISVEETAIAVGHLMYGLDPMAAPTTLGAMRPALRAVRTRLVKTSALPPVQHAAPYLRDACGPLGVIPVGICHGYRPSSPDAFAIVAGRRAAVLRPCLENTILDLAGVPDTPAGTEVILLGGAGSLAIDLPTLATWHQTSPLHVLAFLGRTLSRNHLG